MFRFFDALTMQNEDLVTSFVLSICVVFADLIETKNKIFFYFQATKIDQCMKISEKLAKEHILPL